MTARPRRVQPTGSLDTSGVACR